MITALSIASEWNVGLYTKPGKTEGFTKGSTDRDEKKLDLFAFENLKR